MLARLLKKPSSSILLLGPRGTGKSTWIKGNFPDSLVFDLLNSAEALRLSRNPSVIYNEVRSVSREKWIVIDEIQKVPALLDEVHRLIENEGYRCILSGSSARKLRKGGVNLLAGRAVETHMYPFVSAELLRQHADIQKMMTQGTLPTAVLGENPVSYLQTYAQTYLQEEIKAEALTRSVGNFSRFLEIAARQNGQVTNISNIARESAVARQTVQTYFDILVDTLIGYWIYPWMLKGKTKQVVHPKFYFFDSGVCRALSGRLPYPPSQEEQGPLLETLLFNEIRAYIAYNRLYYPLRFWRNYDGTEVDILCETSRGYIAVEIKASQHWNRRFNRGIKHVINVFGKTRISCYGVYCGGREALFDNTAVMPAPVFLERLWQGEIIQ